MYQLRKDYILDKWVIVSSVRGKRPVQFQKEESSLKAKDCVFCPGNEDKTPSENFRFEEKGKWTIRCFPNKFPAVGGSTFPKNKEKFFQAEPAFGYHEVIVDTREHDMQLHEKNITHLYNLINVWINRILYYRKKSRITYVQVFKNHLKEAGTSIFHSHCQLVASSHIEKLVYEKAIAINKYKRKYKKCPYCDIIKLEKKKKSRIAFENKSFTAICPFASFYGHHVEIYSNRCIKYIWELNESEKKDLAHILKKVISKLGKNNVPYNLVIANGIKLKPFHFHINVAPREFKEGGFEIGTGVLINSVTPENSAAWYKSK